MKRNNPLVSSSSSSSSTTTTTTTTTITTTTALYESLSSSCSSNSSFRSSKSLKVSSFQIAGSGRAGTITGVGCGFFFANISRLLVPFLVLISTTRCTTTTSLSPLGLYKVGIGATNLVDNILGNGIVKSKAISTTTIKTADRTNADGGSGIINQSKNRNDNKKNINEKRDQNINKRKTKNTKTNKRKRREKNRNSVKRSNSDYKKKNARAFPLPPKKIKPESRESAAKIPLETTEASREDTNIKSKEIIDDQSNKTMSIPDISEDDQKFLDRVMASARTVQNWDADKELLKKCRTSIPWDELLGSATINGNHESGDKPYCNSETDRLLQASGICFGSIAGGSDSNALFLQRLCRWFQAYMSWVNAPPCKVCGCTECEMKTVRGPETEEEIAGEAKRVEVYYCPDCKANTTTFPRYNKAAKLLETRQGRCGEYANLFGLFCRSVGFETRLVLDWSDHLWTEVRLGDSWVMADSCEGVIDKPSMYEHGWGKDGLCYMVGIGSDHVVDVTPRYTRKFFTDDFQTRRRSHTTSEETGERILHHVNENMKMKPIALTKLRVEELERRRELENAELRQCIHANRWTDAEKYGSGRISGSMAWRRSRQEAGRDNDPVGSTENTNTTECRDTGEVMGFPAEAFLPARLKKGKISFLLRARPSSRHDGIVVSNTPCAVGAAKSISVVVVDNNDVAFGCILQSKSFLDWDGLIEFIDTLPSGRIVLMNGRIDVGNETKSEEFQKIIDIERLGGWKGDEVAREGVIFAGQIDAHPDWAYCRTLKEATKNKKKDTMAKFEVEIVTEEMEYPPLRCRLRTERSLFPQRIAGRLPEAFMPLNLQQGNATEKEKREAYLRFAESHGGRYCGYTTKKDSPVYLLDSTAYPLQHNEYVASDVLGSNNHTWNTFLELPEPLVATTDCGINDASADAAPTPTYDVPLDSDFFNSSLGPKLLSDVHVEVDTTDALNNARLIGLYFSAPWNGPCRSFTPMLAEVYDHLSDTYPSHGLEIVFVSGDRDEQSFRNYYQTMPWKAIPFYQSELVKQALNITYGVRGIPSFVVLDAVSGEVVVSANESRREVVTACRGGGLRIDAMLQSWLSRTPDSTQELLSMIELSARELKTNADDISDIDHDRIPYLNRKLDALESQQSQDISIRIKAEFEGLVKAGHDPNTAAAKAITIVSETPVDKTKPDTKPRILNAKTSCAGLSRSGLHDRTAEALTYALEQNPISTVSDALSIALKYLKNSQRMPWEPKFRRFELSNKVADKITRVEGGLRLIQSLGFEIVGTSRDFEASIPVAADLNAMNIKITGLIDNLKSTEQV
mmetsp:Transcript_26122/g.61351  ORF Transcript_26122/g.61351 Transcript_26122/m.61351 type:complete len:1311 (-) Transcript_26122:939-4871(-)